MMRNVEIKARLDDKESVIEKVEKLSGSQGTIIKQRDTFFIVQHGRLKLREIQDVGSELIFYDRPNSEGPKLSEYTKYECSESSVLLSVLSQSLGVKGVVSKVRKLFMIGQSRIHIDEVENLGSFFEIEVVLTEDQTVEEGQKIAENIMSSLGIDKNILIAGAYMDLLLKEQNDSGDGKTVH